MMIFFWLFLSRFSWINPSQLPFLAVVIGLTFYNGSVIAELLRSGGGVKPEKGRKGGPRKAKGPAFPGPERPWVFQGFCFFR